MRSRRTQPAEDAALLAVARSMRVLTRSPRGEPSMNRTTTREGLEASLQDLAFPAEKPAILECAERNGADDDRT